MAQNNSCVRISNMLLCAATLLSMLSSADAQALSNPFQSALSAPVRATMKASTNSLKAGDSFNLTVTVRVAKGYHVYAPGGTNALLIPAKLDLTLPKSIVVTGDWNSPPPATDSTGNLIYTNSIIYHRPLKVLPGTSPQTVTFNGKFHFQTCNDEMCLPPDTIELETEITIVK